MELKAKPYLTWQQARVQTTVSQPIAVRDHMPDWWRSLPGDLTTVGAGCPHHHVLESHSMRSAKFCLGLRGARNLGYTIATDRDIVSRLPQQPGSQTAWQKFYADVRDTTWPDCDQESDFVHLPEHIRSECQQVHGYRPGPDPDPAPMVTALLHPEMLHGSRWTERDSLGDYKWNMILMSWPWRVRMDAGWRLLIMANQFDWDPGYHMFTGCVDANYKIQGNNINVMWEWEQPIEAGYNYVNIEMVAAVANGYTIPKGRCLFTAVPVYDPDYEPAQFRPFPNFVTSAIDQTK